jgi:predicted amidohydrolase
MRIALAQLASLRADIAGNLARHEQFVQRAAVQGAEMIVFPELSLTQYEPTIAADVVMTPDDARLQGLQTLADSHEMTICVGVPLRSEAGVIIGMLMFAPGKVPQVYSKRYLHEDELPYFAPGHGGALIESPHGDIAFAICYEISVPQHAQDAHAAGANMYIASVAKTPAGVVMAHERLSEIARTYGMTVLMANCVGECEGKPAGGKSAIWDARGERVVCLGESEEGLLIYDTPFRAVVSDALDDEITEAEIVQAVKDGIREAHEGGGMSVEEFRRRMAENELIQTIGLRRVDSAS